MVLLQQEHPFLELYLYTMKLMMQIICTTDLLLQNTIWN